MVSTLVSSTWLRQQVTSGLRHIRILNASSQSEDAYQEYLGQRIPGAGFFDITAVSDHSSLYPDMLPTQQEFANHVMNLGVGSNNHVVVYDNNEKFGMFTSPRVWWMFRVFGHRQVSVLDGGLCKWVSEGHPVSSGKPDPVVKGNFNAELNLDLVRSFEQMRETLKTRDTQVLDARNEGRFNGEAPEPRVGLPSGHMIGATNLPFKNLINEESKLFKGKHELEKVFEDAGVDSEQPMVATCGSGITACIVAMAANITYNKDIPVYDGSWTEWAQRAPKDTVTEGVVQEEETE